MEQNSNIESKEQEPKQDTINTLIILGNGYDISYGYRTSYNDFIKSELFTENKTDNDLFWRIIRKDEYENWSDLEALLYIHAKDLEREFNDVSLPDNGLAPLPKKGEAGQLIKDFKEEYKKLHDGLCVFLSHARTDKTNDDKTKKKTNTKKELNTIEAEKINLNDYTKGQIYSIYQRSLPKFKKVYGKYEIDKKKSEERYLSIQEINETLNKDEYKNSFSGITKEYHTIERLYNTAKKMVEREKKNPNKALRALDEVETAINNMKEHYSKIEKEPDEIQNNKESMKIILNHINYIAKETIKQLEVEEKAIENVKNGTSDSIYNYIIKLYPKFDEKLINIGNFHQVDDNLSEIYGLFQDKETKIEKFNNEQKEILRIIVATDIQYRRFYFEEVQKGWGKLCNPDDSHILTFNYTSLNDCIKKCVSDKEDHILYVHGKLKEKTNETEKDDVKNSKIVLGIDENMKVHRAFNFLHKSYQEGINIVNLSDILRSARRFIIYGCSIGSTDKWYFEQIFMDNEGHIAEGRVFEIYFYNDDAKESIQDCITNIVGDLMEFQTKNFVKWIRVEGTGLLTAYSQQKSLDDEELKYLGYHPNRPEEEENPASPR